MEQSDLLKLVLMTFSGKHNRMLSLKQHPHPRNPGAGTSAEALLHEAFEVSREQLVEWASGRTEEHPLRQIQAMAALDRLDPEGCDVKDHGSWKGQWQLPSRTQWERREALEFDMAHWTTRL